MAELLGTILTLLLVGVGVVLGLALLSGLFKVLFEIALIPFALLGLILKGLFFVLVLPLAVLALAPVILGLVGILAAVIIPLALCLAVCWAGAALLGVAF